MADNGSSADPADQSAPGPAEGKEEHPPSPALQHNSPGEFVPEQRPDPPTDTAPPSYADATQQQRPAADAGPQQPKGGQQPQDMGDVSMQARAAMKSATAWFSSVSIKAKDAAISAGQQLDKAAIQVGMKVDELSNRAEQAYGEKASRQLAGTMQQRDVYRGTQETAFSAEKLERLQTHGDELIAQCIQLAGDVQQEMQYASTETPLGKESYGLMMLVNVLVPLLEHGVRPDWKAILPPAAILQGTQYAANLMIHMRSHAPSAFALLLAAERGWRSEPGTNLGAVDVEEMKQISSHEHKLQAWLYSSLNQGLLAKRLTQLLSLSFLQEDWLFPWAVIRRPGALDELLTELVKIESQPGLVHLPVEELRDMRPAAQRFSGWSEKMSESFARASDVALAAGQKAYTKASEIGVKVSGAVKENLRDLSAEDADYAAGGPGSPTYSAGGRPDRTAAYATTPAPPADPEEAFELAVTRSDIPTSPPHMDDPVSMSGDLVSQLSFDHQLPTSPPTTDAKPAPAGTPPTPADGNPLDAEDVVADSRFGLDDDEDDEFFAAAAAEPQPAAGGSPEAAKHVLKEEPPQQPF